jgi:ubiquitin
LTADNKATSEAYKSIAATGCVPQHCKVLLVTGLADYGLSIYNDDLAAAVAVDAQTDRISADVFRQFSARFREKNYPTYLVMSERRDQAADAAHEYRKQMKGAAEIAEALDKIAQVGAEIYEGADLPQLSGRYRDACYYDGERFQANPFAVFQDVDQRVQAGVSTEKLLQDLAQDFLIQAQAQAETEAQDIKEQRKQRKANRKGERQAARDLIQENGLAVIDSDEWPTGEGYKVEARRARQLAAYGVAESEIPSILAEDENAARWKRRIRRLDIAYADQHTDQLNVYSAAGAVEALHIRETLEALAGQWLTAEQVAEALNNSSPTIPATYTKGQAIEWMKTLFNVNTARPRVNGRKTWMYQAVDQIQTKVFSPSSLDLDQAADQLAGFYAEAPF